MVKMQIFCGAIILVTLQIVPGTLGIEPAPVPQASQVIKHRFACADYSQGKIFIVNEDGKVEWEYPARNCNDLWVLPNGNLLFNTGFGVKEVTREKRIVFDYQSDRKSVV